MELNDALALATLNFLSLTADVTEEDLTKPTPCEEWTVAQLLEHVARGSDMTVELLKGASQDEARAMFDRLPPSDPVSACHHALNAQLVAMESTSDLDQVVHHPIGDVPARQLYDFRIGDLTLHAWDLARALGEEEELPDPLVEHVYAVLQPMEAFIGDIGLFGSGPSGNLAPDSTMQAKLLDLTGRRP